MVCQNTYTKLIENAKHMQINQDVRKRCWNRIGHTLRTSKSITTKSFYLNPKGKKKRTTKKPLRELETDKWHGDGVEVTARGSNRCANEE